MAVDWVGKVGTWTKVKYGAAGLGAGLTDMPISLLMLPLYTEFLGVPPYVAGLVALIAGWWDAIVDPLVGILSDRTRTRLGRRRPFLLAFAFPLGFSFWWLFNPWLGNIGASFLVAFLLFKLAFSSVMIPLYSLGAEMSPNYDERTSIMSFVRSFAIVGLLLGVAMPLLALRLWPNGTEGYNAVGAIVGVVVVVTVLVSFFGTRENPTAYRAEKKQTGTMKAVRVFVANRAFWCTMAGHLGGQVGSQVSATLLVYFGLHYMKISVDQAMMAVLPYMIGSLVAIPVWNRISSRYDKKIALSGALFVAGLGMLCVLVVPPGGLYLLMAVIAVAGLGFGAVLVLPLSMMAEVVDTNELKTGERWEGAAFGLLGFIEKLSRNAAVFIAMAALSWLGYVSQGPQPAGLGEGIRYLTISFPLLAYWVGGILVLLYPISRSAYHDIRRQLESQKASA